MTSSALAQRVGDRACVVAAGVTGSGRTMIGKLIGAVAVRDEITAQARAAAAADSQVETVFEIGGQDSKYISLVAGQVADFQMNKVCAAGTVEEVAAGEDLEDRFLQLVGGRHAAARYFADRPPPRR